VLEKLFLEMRTDRPETFDNYITISAKLRLLICKKGTNKPLLFEIADRNKIVDITDPRTGKTASLTEIRKFLNSKITFPLESYKYYARSHGIDLNKIPTNKGRDKIVTNEDFLYRLSSEEGAHVDWDISPYLNYSKMLASPRAAPHMPPHVEFCYSLAGMVINYSRIMCEYYYI
jgi:hypothetical protein